MLRFSRKHLCVGPGRSATLGTVGLPRQPRDRCTQRQGTVPVRLHPNPRRRRQEGFPRAWTGSGYAVDLQAVNSSTGAEVWSRNQPQYGQIVSPPIATSKVVYVTTGDGWTLGYSTTTGTLVWSAKGGGYLNTQNERLTNPGQAIGGGVLATTATNRLVVFG